MDMSSTPEGTGITEAQAAERLIARYQSDEDQGEAGEMEAVEQTEPEEFEADPEEGQVEDNEGDPDAEPDEPEGEPEPSQTFKVKVDGEEVEVPLDELLKGYSREQDYTRKTQALSEERKSLVESRDRYASQLEAVQQIIDAAQPRVDQSLRETNPAEWSAQMLQHRQWAEQKAAVDAERNRLRAEAEKEKQQARSNLVKEEGAKLLDAIPEWKDEAVSKAEQAKIADYALKAGLSPEEIDNIVDHRVIVALRKSMLFDELMAKKPEVQAKVQQVKNLKPAAKTAVPRSDVKQLRERLANSGSTDVAAALILAKQRRP